MWGSYRILIWTGYFTSGLTALLAADVSSGDPLSLFTSIGVGGLIAAMTYLWQRDTASARDKALDIAANLADNIKDFTFAVERSTKAQEEGTEVARKMLNVLENMPPRDTWTRILIALETRDRR
jgi:hypothetical protein